MRKLAETDAPPVPASSHTRTEVLCTYSLLVDPTGVSGIHCESYGLAILDHRTGREARLRRLTLRLELALSLLELLVRHQVSPLHLADVVEDYMAQQTSLAPPPAKYPGSCRETETFG